MTMTSPDRRQALLVEDDHGCDFEAMVLEEFDFSVSRVRTAEEAIGHLQQRGGATGLVVADMRLAGAMDGVDLARSVSILWPQISIIVMSAHPVDRPAHLPEGTVYVPKPWQPLQLVDAASRAARADHSVHAIQF